MGVRLIAQTKKSNEVTVEDLVTRTTFKSLESNPNFENCFEGIPSPHNWLDLSQNTRKIDRKVSENKNLLHGEDIGEGNGNSENDLEVN